MKYSPQYYVLVPTFAVLALHLAPDLGSSLQAVFIAALESVRGFAESGGDPSYLLLPIIVVGSHMPVLLPASYVVGTTYVLLRGAPQSLDLMIMVGAVELFVYLISNIVAAQTGHRTMGAELLMGTLALRMVLLGLLLSVRIDVDERWLDRMYNKVGPSGVKPTS